MWFCIASAEPTYLQIFDSPELIVSAAEQYKEKYCVSDQVYHWESVSDIQSAKRNDQVNALQMLMLLQEWRCTFDAWQCQQLQM
jgi:2-hydroxy-3-keto-5-methylthiopentenyl-1-phosphate phosphatase